MSYEVVVNGLFTILGAAIGGAIQKYGFPFLSIGRTIVCEGTGEDLEILTDTQSFRRPQRLRYDFDSGQIRIKGHHAKFDAQIKTKMGDEKTVATGRLSARGTFANGFLYLIYKVRNTNKTEWQGALVLKIPEWGNIDGYWLTNNTQTDGIYLFGHLTLQRK
jgi:hypothetical protein